MVATNKILLPECTGEGCGGDNDICADSRVHHRNAESRAPVTRNNRSDPILGRWLTRDPIGYQGGINLYGYVESGPVGMVDPEGESHGLSGSQMRVLAADVDAELFNLGTAGDGWTPRSAPLFVAEAMDENYASAQVLSEEHNLIGIAGTARFVGGEWTAGAVGKQVVKRGGKYLLHHLTAVKPARDEILLRTWRGKVENSATGKDKGIYATSIITYDPNTETFTVGIMGYVGQINSNGGAKASCRFKGFFYKYRGATIMRPGGFLWFHWKKVGIVKGSWQRIE